VRTACGRLEAARTVATRSTGMHALRHFYASALLDAGESIKAVSAYLGHCWRHWSTVAVMNVLATS
jgi:site-specific recombinase XerD